MTNDKSPTGRIKRMWPKIHDLPEMQDLSANCVSLDIEALDAAHRPMTIVGVDYGKTEARTVAYLTQRGKGEQLVAKEAGFVVVHDSVFIDPPKLTGKEPDPVGDDKPLSPGAHYRRPGPGVPKNPFHRDDHRHSLRNTRGRRK